MSNRRTFLRAGALLAAAGVLACEDSSKSAAPLGSVGPKSSAKKSEVIVIGAGMAGLAAARDLNKAGKQAPVTVANQALTKTGHVLGSPLYMSPEQFTKVKSVDFRTDLWSLAVVAYQCLAVSTPFMGEALGNVIMAVVSRDDRPIAEVKPALPAALDDWFARAFHLDLEQRFQSAKELAASFAEIAYAAADPGEPRPQMLSNTELTETAAEPAAAALQALILAAVVGAAVAIGVLR